MSYLLFGGDDFYPNGGWGDFQGSFDSVREAEVEAQKKAPDYRDPWWHIVDADALVAVATSSKDGRIGVWNAAPRI